MESNPLFSIVMPAYNVAAYIGNAIRSIQRQTVRDWELVVVDDASTDATADVVRAAMQEDSRIRLVSHSENRGASAARNTGIDAATGLYIWLPDPDDVFDADLLEQCARALAINPAVVTVFGITSVFVDGNGAQQRAHSVAFPEAFCASAVELRPLILPLERSTLYGYSANKVYDREFLHSTGARWENAPLIEDFFFNVRVFQDATSMNIIPTAPYQYTRRESGSLTGAFVPEYYPLHRRRILEMRDQLASWELLDDDAKAVLGSLFIRYILSAVQQTYDPRSGMTQEGRKAWLREVFADELFCDLVPHARANDALLKAAIVPFKARNVQAVLALGKLVDIVRRRSFLVYRIAAQGR